MTKALKFDAVLFLVIGAAVGLFLISYMKSQPIQFHSDASFTQAVIEPTAIPTTIIPTTAFTSQIISSSQISSDGTKTVTVTTKTNKDNTKTYSVSTDNGTSTIYSIMLGTNESVTIPFNTWSPDNHYFFIQENTKAGPKVLVFQADGEAFADGNIYLDLTDAYQKRATGNSFDAATGWAANNIMLINTKQNDGTQGSSYWFEVPSKAVIQLSTKF